MTDNVTKQIVSRRQELGLTDTEVAKQCDFSIHEYFDIELHSDEIFTVTPLRFVKKLCEVLKLDFLELFEIRCPFCDETQAFAEDYRLPRNEVILKRRKWKGLSATELGDRLDFNEAEIDLLETDSERLESWPLRFIENLSRELGVPFQFVVGIKCKRCGH